jgi:hypothetical protein
MNPFDLPGPQFLVFYGVLATLTILAAALATRQAENGVPPRVNLSDPYGIAYLRGGKNEALRLATVLWSASPPFTWQEENGLLVRVSWTTICTTSQTLCTSC